MSLGFYRFLLKITDMHSDFFEDAGKQLSHAVFMLAQGSRYPDPIMCDAILALTNLSERLKVAKINPWVRHAFDQFISTSGSEPTAASIVATASGMVSRISLPSALKDISEAEVLARYEEAERLLPLPSLLSDCERIKSGWSKL